MLIAFNSFVSLPTLVFADLYSSNWEVKYSIKIEDMPDSKTLMATVAFCMICEDFAFHLTHRFLHWRVIYPYIHKIHH